MGLCSPLFFLFFFFLHIFKMKICMLRTHTDKKTMSKRNPWLELCTYVSSVSWVSPSASMGLFPLISSLWGTARSIKPSSSTSGFPHLSSLKGEGDKLTTLVWVVTRWTAFSVTNVAYPQCDCYGLWQCANFEKLLEVSWRLHEKCLLSCYPDSQVQEILFSRGKISVPFYHLK